jgi:hypothetical protein
MTARNFAYRNNLRWLAASVARALRGIAVAATAGGALLAFVPAESQGQAQKSTTIDWRVLGGLDYMSGVTSDSLKKLDGTVVRIPGFVVPLDDFTEEGAEFLLVPYYGACIHSPPPPPNQMVFVQMEGKKNIKLTLFDAVWLEGRLKVTTVESPYGAVGFQLDGMSVKAYGAQ